MSDYEIELINKAKSIILDYNNPNRISDIKDIMREVYKYFKGVVTNTNGIDVRLLEIFKLEQLMRNEFLPLKNEPIFDINNSPIAPTSIKSNKDCEDILNYIVHQVRTKINEYKDVKSEPLTAFCIHSSSYVSDVCKTINNVDDIRFSCNEDLSTGVYHCFNIVTLELPDGDTKQFLVDCTYRQFFTYSDSFVERIGLLFNSGPNIGSYMMMDDERKKIAEELLQKGFIELTPKVLKCYFDSFVYSGRNGLFYEKMNKDVIEVSDYTPHYTCEDYIEALNFGGLHEEYIGRQSEPLKASIDFNDTVQNKKKLS